MAAEPNGGIIVARKPKTKDETTLIDVVGAEFAGVPVQSVKTGAISQMHFRRLPGGRGQLCLLPKRVFKFWKT